MPFKFTGEKPAWQGSAGTFTSFSAARPAGANNSTAFASVPSFGAAPSPWSSFAASPPTPSALDSAQSNILHSPNDTTPASAEAAKPSELPGEVKSTKCALVAAEVEALGRCGADDVLMQALKRGVTGRPAVFGHTATASDDAIKRFVAAEGLSAEESKPLLACVAGEIRGLGEESVAKKLLDHLLGEVIRLQAPGLLRGTMNTKVSTPTPEKNAALPAWLTGDLESRPAERALEQQLGNDEADINAPTEANVEESTAPVENSADQTPGAARFRFLDLPAELRVWVYRELLAPLGYIALRVSEEHQHHRGVVPSYITPAILGASRQIYNEAKDILYEGNIIYIGIHVWYGNHEILRDTCIADESLPRLKKAMLLLNNSHVQLMKPEMYGKMDWRELQAVTGLQQVRLACIDNVEHRGTRDGKKALMEQVIERLPKDCKLSYCTVDGAEKEHVKDMLEECIRSSKRRGYNIESYEVESGVLEECAKDYISKLGCKSGHTRDHRFPEKKQGWQLGSLVKDGEVDDSNVLGR